jgi:hypothetical protein
VWVKRDFLARRLTFDCRCLSQFVDEAGHVWQELGYTSLDDMIQRGLELEPGEIHAARQWLELNAPQEAIPLQDVVLLARGRPKKGKGKSGYTHFKSHGSRERDVARLNRDRKDLAARVIAGELSPNAGMIEAGFRHSLLSRIPADDVTRAVAKLIKHYGLAAVIKAVQAASHEEP